MENQEYTENQEFAADQHNVIRLGGPIKKGLMRLVFSRFLLIVFLILLQAFTALAVYVYYMEKVPMLFSVRWVFILIMVIYLFNNRMDASAKLTWMLIISLFPMIGTFFLLFTQSNIGHRVESRRIGQQINDTRGIIEQDERVIKEVRHDGSGTDDLSKFLCKTGCFPLYGNTEVTYYPLGDEMFEAMIRELEKAEKFIFMEFFIVEEGYMWGRILDILLRKARKGVEVRFMYDGMCEISTLPEEYWKLLEKKRIQAKTFSPLTPLVSSHYNYRDHRKILVIDGKTAFNGGVNLADEYINRIERFGHWKDAGVMIKGEAVKSFTLMFLQMWNIGIRQAEYKAWLNDTDIAADDEQSCDDANGFVMPYADCPLDDYKAGETVYMDILNRATEYVHIMTPYLILDGELESSLKYAAQRGVDVKIILPGIPDKKVAFSLAKTHYRSLTESGVKIYEYTPGFVHSKVFVCDDIKAVVGTINLDYRSLYHHFECATYLYKTDCIADIEKDFQDTLSKCRQVTAETIRHEKMSYRIVGGVAKLISPLM